MQCHPCPQCGIEFANLTLLNIHVRYLHREAAAQLSPPPPPLEQSRDPTPESEEEEGNDDTRLSSGTLPPFGSSTEAYIIPVMSVDSMHDVYKLGAAKIGEPAIPPLPQELKQTPRPHQDLGPSTRPFMIVYEAKGFHVTQRIHIPCTESYEAFLDRMARVSAPVAGSFITGRATGFTRDDGPWSYSLASRKRGILQPGAQLTSNIMYQAMISELLKAYSPWSWALVWHVSD